MSHSSDWTNETHPGLEWLRGSRAGSAWLDKLPQLVQECADQWVLVVGAPFAYAFASLALPATCQDGRAAVLKIQFPDRESLHEAAALDVWDGHGAVKLLAYDPGRRALLIERCLPGTPLSELDPERALDIAIELVPRLWKPASAPFTPLAEEAETWTADLKEFWEHAGAPFERRLLDAALEALEELPDTQGQQVLIHQDLHADNILRAEREPWLVIDPKPLTAEREFSVVALVRGGELGHDPRSLGHRLDRLSTELGLDRERVRRWTIAQTLAWGFDEDTVLDHQIEIARWLLEARS